MLTLICYDVKGRVLEWLWCMRARTSWYAAVNLSATSNGSLFPCKKWHAKVAPHILSIHISPCPSIFRPFALASTYRNTRNCLFQVCGGETGTSNIDDFIALDTAERFSPMEFWLHKSQAVYQCATQNLRGLNIQMKHLNIYNLVLSPNSMHPVLFCSFCGLVTRVQDPCALNVDQECFLFTMFP